MKKTSCCFITGAMKHTPPCRTTLNEIAAHAFSCPHLRKLLAAFSAVVMAFSGTAHAAGTYYWDTATGTWSTGANWSTNSTSGGPTGTVPGSVVSADVVVFNQSSVNGNELIYLNGNRPSVVGSIAAMTFANTGTTGLLGGTSGTPAANSLTLGASGITVNSGAGAVTIGDTSGSPTAQVNLLLGTSTSFTNNSGSLLTIANGVTSNAVSATQTLTIAGSNAGGVTFAGVIGNGGTGGTMALLVNTTGGVTALTGTNTYTGSTSIAAGVLRAVDGVGFSSSSVLALNGGILESSGTFTRTISTAAGAGHFYWNTNGGGFSAYGSKLIVNAGGISAPVNWSASAGGGIVGTLMFGSTTANAETEFQNPVNLNTGVGGTRTIQVTAGTGGDFATMSGVISNAAVAGITKTGNGTLNLTAANTYSGITYINGGTIKAGGSETAGTSGPLGKSAAANAGNIVFGGGALQYSSVNNNDYSGRFSTAENQPISIDTNGRSVSFGTALTSSGGTLTLNDTNATTGALTLSGAGANTYSGLTSINNGELDLGKTSAIAVAGNLAVGDGTGAIDTSTAKLISSNQIAASSAVTINSDGRLALNSFSNTVASLSSVGGDITSATAGGNLTVTAAPAFSGTGNTIGAGATVTSSNAATLAGSGTLAINGTLASGLGVATGATVTGTGSVTGNTTLTGSGIINLGSGGNIGGTLEVTGGNWNGLGSVTGAVTSSSGTLAIGNGANLTATGGLAVTGSGSISAGNSTSTITGSVNYTSSSNSTFAGVIAGGTKTVTMNNSAAVLTLSGNNTYTGGTTVTAGTLLVSGGGLTGTSDLAVSGGKLQLGASNVLNDVAITLSSGTFSTGATTGFNETLGTLDLNTAATLTLALGTGVHALHFADSRSINWSGSTLTITGWTGTAGASGTDGKIFFGSSAAGLTSGQLSQINFSGYSNGATILSTGEIVAVPEPATWGLLAFSLTTVMVLRRRRNS